MTEYLKIIGISVSRKYSNKDDCDVNGAVLGGKPLCSIKREWLYLATLPRHWVMISLGMGGRSI